MSACVTASAPPLALDSSLAKPDCLNEKHTLVPCSSHLSSKTLSPTYPALLKGEEVDLGRVDGGRGAVQFLLAAFLLETVLWGSSFSFGVWQVYYSLAAPFNTSSPASIASIGTVMLAIEYISPLFVMPVFHRYPDHARKILWTASLVSVASMTLSSFATAIWQLILLQGVICGLCGGILYVPILLWLQEWFVLRRGLATGLIFAGTGLGGFVFPFMINALTARVGFAWTTRIWALFTWITFTLSLRFMKPRLPVLVPSPRPPLIPPSLSFLKDRVILSMVGTTFASSLSFFPIALFIPLYISRIGDSNAAALSLSIFNIASVGGGIVSGWASDVISYGWICAIIGISSSLATFLGWGFADNVARTFGFVALFGFFSGICSIWPAVGREVAGEDPHLPSLIFGTFAMSRGIASIVGPILATQLFDPMTTVDFTGWGHFGFDRVILFVGVTSFISGVGGIVVEGARRYKKKVSLARGEC